MPGPGGGGRGGGFGGRGGSFGGGRGGNSGFGGGTPADSAAVDSVTARAGRITDPRTDIITPFGFGRDADITGTADITAAGDFSASCFCRSFCSSSSLLCFSSLSALPLPTLRRAERSSSTTKSWRIMPMRNTVRSSAHRPHTRIIS